MNRKPYIFLALFFCSFCIEGTEKPLDYALKNPDVGVLAVAHRACWEHAPENSIKAIEDCITMGVNIVEIDVRQARGGELILMHDSSINRTTSGKGKVRDLSLSKLKKQYLINGEGEKKEY